MDFLHQFGSTSNANTENQGDKSKSFDSEEIELSLDLSSNGMFGVDPKGKMKLIRSSSIASILPLPKKEMEEFSGLSVPTVATSSLTRTTSLPVETEESVRKRKEMQCLKRLEVKKKRLERRNSLKSGGNSREKMESEVTGTDSGSINRYQNGIIKSNGFSAVSLRAVSLGSQGSNSSYAVSSDIAAQGMENKTRVPRINGTTNQAQNSNTISRTNSMVDEMPCVSTKGENGRIIEGFLYNFKKGGGEVRIVCVCHGSFLTPAEFVKHAGGGDVTNPLRHITVNASGVV
ncbi:hypothetical protein LUZ60_006470 [Juncus effusus]|nr:hypothetical protein LUZ60_006470 [Juncus effusus]